MSQVLHLPVFHLLLWSLGALFAVSLGFAALWFCFVGFVTDRREIRRSMYRHPSHVRLVYPERER